MSGINQITIVGNVGSPPELSYGQNNIPYCRFSVAVNEQWKTDGEKRSKVTWFPVIAFNGVSEACANYLDRGRLVAIQGRVHSREYEDRSGVRHEVMQVVAEKVTFLGASKAGDAEEHRPSPGKPRGEGEMEDASPEGPPF